MGRLFCEACGERVRSQTVGEAPHGRNSWLKIAGVELISCFRLAFFACRQAEALEAVEQLRVLAPSIAEDLFERLQQVFEFVQFLR